MRTSSLSGTKESLASVSALSERAHVAPVDFLPFSLSNTHMHTLCKRMGHLSTLHKNRIVGFHVNKNTVMLLLHGRVT